MINGVSDMDALKKLVWIEDADSSVAQHEFVDYRVIPDHDSYGKFAVHYKDSNSQPATGFATVVDAKEWANDNYNKKMQPFISQPTLSDAVTMLVDACHGASVKGGWWHDIATGEPLQRNKLEMIALIHSEVSEAVEGVRKGINDDHLPAYPMEDVEMADALIRIFDYIGGHKLQSANALVDKLAYNANRADHKVENRIKDGGKKY